MSKTSMPANFLNRTALPSITGFDARGPMAPRPKHRSAVAEDRDQILARSVDRRAMGIGRNRLAWKGDAWRIGEREVALIGERLGRA